MTTNSARQRDLRRSATLLVNIFERRQEAQVTTTRLVEVTRDTTDPAKWGANWPKQYDGYKLMAQLTKTCFGGHGGSEALPQEKIDKDPWLKRMFLGYASRSTTATGAATPTRRPPRPRRRPWFRWPLANPELSARLRAAVGLWHKVVQVRYARTG